MEKLKQVIEEIRQKLPNLKRHSLKETSTRTIIIDPLLEALGWNVRDPDDVQLEYPTVDGKSVDYALKINKKPVLLVEAKALDDPLTDVKSVTQVISYAANDGIVWCILTNGLKWKVYNSSEECAAPEKLLFEVDLDSDEKEVMTTAQTAKQLWRLSAEEMARGSLTDLGEQIFTDGKVRKTLLLLMTNPPRALLNLLKKSQDCQRLSAEQLKNSLSRIARDILYPGKEVPPDGPKPPEGGKKGTRTPSRAKKGESPYTEEHHTSGKPREIINLYQMLDAHCLNLAPEGLTRRFLAKYISYEYADKCFCSVHLDQSGLRVWLRLRYSQLQAPPSFARDVSGVGHWGRGDVELKLCTQSELEEALPLIRRSLDNVSHNKT